MFLVIGLVVVLITVFGGFAWSGGSFGIILKSLPYELTIIFGGAVGGFISGNSSGIIRDSLRGVGTVMKGAKWTGEDYKDLLSLMFLLIKLVRSKGIVALEAHIENPEESKIFQLFPKIANDHHVIEFITDYFRMLTMNFDDPNQMEDAMNADIAKIEAEEHAPQHSLQVMSEGLPAVGIVAAVLGIIKTMGAISQPVEILGGLVGGALVGTFLGIFLSYLMIGPIASRLKQILEEDGAFIQLIKVIMVSHLQGNAPQVSVELGRRSIPSHHMPSFLDVEEAIAELPTDV